MLKTLQNWQEIQKCRQQLQDKGLDFTEPKKTRLWRFFFDLRFRYNLLCPHPDFIKSWDVVKTTELIESIICNKQDPILDMGCFNSEILYVLHALGDQSLYGCDLNPICRWMPFWHKIRYQVADLTETSYPDKYFAAITCLSVIEHGIPLNKLIQEVQRILRPGGLFIFTTDYDATGQEHIIPADFRMFGQTWIVFGQNELHQLIQQFKDVGFELLKPGEVMDTHVQCPIFWHGHNYTFTMVAMRAPGEGS